MSPASRSSSGAHHSGRCRRVRTAAAQRAEMVRPLVLELVLMLVLVLVLVLMVLMVLMVQVRQTGAANVRRRGRPTRTEPRVAGCCRSRQTH